MERARCGNLSQSPSPQLRTPLRRRPPQSPRLGIFPLDELVGAVSPRVLGLDSVSLLLFFSSLRLSRDFLVLLYAAGCFRISANACIRAESPELFPAAASFSSDGAIFFSFATLPLFMCELSAL